MNPIDLLGGSVFFSELCNQQNTMTKGKNEPELPPHMNPESDLPPDADVEERFNEFWKKNGTGIFGGIAIGAVLVVGIQIFQYMGRQKEAAIQEAFSAVETVEERLEFASEYSKHPLAALANLQVADIRYGEGLFAEAVNLYAEAAESFEDPVLVARAQLGEAMSLIRSGQVDAGQAMLEKLALESGVLDQVRGEAAYHLAVSHWEAGEVEKALEAADIILQLDNASVWAYRANALREKLDSGDSDS